MSSINDRLSERMRVVADMVTKGKKVADIGCDHAFISIYLVENNISPYVIAMDVRKGPLASAEKNISDYRVTDRVDLRLSDGFEGLMRDETDAAVIAGMGGLLMLRLIEMGSHIIHNGYELILQPQSEISEVRKYLRRNGYTIEKEAMLFEEGKYYTVIKAVKKEDGISQEESNPLQEIFDNYGEYLIQTKSDVLREYLFQEKEKRTLLLTSLMDKESEKAKERIPLLRQEIEMVKQAISLMDEEE